MALELKLDDQAKKGEDYDFVFNILSVLQDYQADQLVSAIQSDCTNNGGPLWALRWNIEKVPDAPYDKLHIVCKVMRNPILIGALGKLILRFAVALLIYLGLDKVFKIGKIVEETIKEAPLTAGLGVVVAVFISLALVVLILR